VQQQLSADVQHSMLVAAAISNTLGDSQNAQAVQLVQYSMKTHHVNLNDFDSSWFQHALIWLHKIACRPGSLDL
jgi:hypothetical protein